MLLVQVKIISFVGSDEQISSKGANGISSLHYTQQAFIPGAN
jgi:hypothetical protein